MPTNVLKITEGCRTGGQCIIESDAPIEGLVVYDEDGQEYTCVEEKGKFDCRFHDYKMEDANRLIYRTGWESCRLTIFKKIPFTPTEGALFERILNLGRQFENPENRFEILLRIAWEKKDPSLFEEAFEATRKIEKKFHSYYQKYLSLESMIEMIMKAGFPKIAEKIVIKIAEKTYKLEPDLKSALLRETAMAMIQTNQLESAGRIANQLGSLFVDLSYLGDPSPDDKIKAAERPKYDQAIVLLQIAQAKKDSSLCVQALEIATQMRNQEWKAEIFGQSLYVRRDPSHVEKAIALADSVGESRDYVLHDTIEVMIHTGFLDRALALTRTIHNWELFEGIAQAFIEVGDYEKAIEVSKIAKGVQDEIHIKFLGTPVKDEILQKTAIAMAEKGFFDRAIALIPLFDHRGAKIDTTEQIVLLMGGAGLIDRAVALADSVPEISRKIEVFGKLAYLRGDKELFARAVKMARPNLSDFFVEEALKLLVGYMINLGFFQEAIQATRMLEDASLFTRTDFLVQIANAMDLAGVLDENTMNLAVQSVRKIEHWDHLKRELTENIVSLMAKRGFFDMAFEIVQDIDNLDDQASALEIILAPLVEKEMVEKAFMFVQRLSGKRGKDAKRRGCVAIVRKMAEMRQLKRATEIVEKMRNTYWKAVAMLEIGLLRKDADLLKKALAVAELIKAQELEEEIREDLAELTGEHRFLELEEAVFLSPMDGWLVSEIRGMIKDGRFDEAFKKLSELDYERDQLGVLKYMIQEIKPQEEVEVLCPRYEVVYSEKQSQAETRQTH